MKKAFQKTVIVIVLASTVFFVYSAIKAIEKNRETFNLVRGI